MIDEKGTWTGLDENRMERTVLERKGLSRTGMVRTAWSWKGLKEVDNRVRR